MFEINYSQLLQYEILEKLVTLILQFEIFCWIVTWSSPLQGVCPCSAEHSSISWQDRPLAESMKPCGGCLKIKCHNLSLGPFINDVTHIGPNFDPLPFGQNKNCHFTYFYYALTQLITSCALGLWRHLWMSPSLKICSGSCCFDTYISFSHLILARELHSIIHASLGLFSSHTRVV